MSMFFVCAAQIALGTLVKADVASLLIVPPSLSSTAVASTKNHDNENVTSTTCATLCALPAWQNVISVDILLRSGVVSNAYSKASVSGDGETLKFMESCPRMLSDFRKCTSIGIKHDTMLSS